MKYWILMPLRSNELEICIYWLPKFVIESDIFFNEWISIQKTIDTIKINFDFRKDVIITDFINVPNRLGLLISKKILSIFNSLDICNIQYFNTSIIWNNSLIIKDEYFIANIIWIYNCIDLKKSNLEFYNDWEIEFINKLVIKKDINFWHIFRLAEFPSLVVIDDELKNKLLESNITWIKIYDANWFSL